ncbi:gluconate 2-dehydrogenase subunit 3 family protein [Lacibacter sediminis]|uniref:Gluconate 2-dehydrogenase subunit 3 family protein n=1 Tax=Lacibacter sediminis TaxID=2760713 RepID=A0A7G5XG39_9BACT|nr:gluconate 2-dehydrogenase subunit 3 family protein [Lacibacter sediminis]QNA44442.1 gluconate 2-dehydrogenase subunit 3 family protein [Lacibacter sediminis]
MNRRDLLKQIALLTGGAVIGGELFLAGCKTGPKTVAEFSPTTISFLDEVAETIIPATSTPGAKAAKVGEFMKVMVTDCYTQRQQDAFMSGIGELDTACEKMHSKSFMDCTPEQRKAFLVSLEKEAKEFNQKRDEADKPLREEHNKKNEALAWKDQTEFEGAPSHYYTMMKQLTLTGFFTSKTGMTETLRHVPIPGKYDGEFPYAKGDKAWAE